MEELPEEREGRTHEERKNEQEDAHQKSKKESERRARLLLARALVEAPQEPTGSPSHRKNCKNFATVPTEGHAQVTKEASGH